MSKKSSTNYTDEFKQSSAKLAATSNKTIREVANELRVNAKTLYGWVKRYYPHQQAKLGRWSDIEQELHQLRKENVRLKQERDILKKATAYFANPTR